MTIQLDKSLFTVEAIQKFIAEHEKLTCGYLCDHEHHRAYDLTVELMTERFPTLTQHTLFEQVARTLTQYAGCC
jgi:hypothetical protein